MKSDAYELGMVIPCYNEQDVLETLVRELKAFADDLQTPAYFLFVDDGSTDRTSAILEKVCEEDSRFSTIRFSRNFGHQTAVSAGLQHIRGNVIAVIDADLQDPLSVVTLMIEKLKDGYEVVYGVRKNRKEIFLLRLAYAGFYRLLSQLAQVPIPLDAGDFCVMDRVVVDHVNAMPEHNRYIRGLRSWTGFKQIGLPYDRQARAAGVPKYNLVALLKLASDGIISFSAAPLRIAVVMGMLVAFFGFVYLIYAIATAFLSGTAPPGWTSLTVLLLFIGGIQLMVLGIIGEYIGRVFDEVKNRPQYIISTKQGWVQN